MDDRNAKAGIQQEEDGQQGGPVRLDLTALQRYFDAMVPGCAGPLAADLVLGGRSNLTYRVTDGSSTWAVRRPPVGGLTPSAHDVGREYRVMEALWDSGVAVPRTVSLCTDPDIIGAPFSVVSWVNGRVLRSADDVQGVPAADLSDCARAMVTQLVRLHGLSYMDLGLSSFGRPQGYLRRQLIRWRQQWDLISVDVPAPLSELHGLLEAAVPAESAATIVHGDYRLDNLIFAADSLSEVRAVVDWELSTLGDPLADLGTLLAYQHPAVDGLLGSPASTAANFPPAREIAREYEQASGRDLTGLHYYLAFSYFKIAVIAQGVHSRYLQGVTVGEGFSEADQSVPLPLEAGLEVMRTARGAG